jgi:hypothetical protein
MQSCKASGGAPPGYEYTIGRAPFGAQFSRVFEFRPVAQNHPWAATAGVKPAEKDAVADPAVHRCNFPTDPTDASRA